MLLILMCLLIVVGLWFLPNKSKTVRIQGTVLKVDEKRTTPLLEALYKAEKYKYAFYTLLVTGVLWFSLPNERYGDQGVFVVDPEGTTYYMPRDSARVYIRKYGYSLKK